MNREKKHPGVQVTAARPQTSPQTSGVDRTTRREFLSRSARTAAGLAAGGALLSAVGVPAFAQRRVIVRFWKSPHSEFERERIGKIVADFERLHPNIHIEHTITAWETWDETYTAAFAGGNPPDVAYMPDQFYVKFAERGLLADLAPFANDPSYASERQAWFPHAWNMGNWGGAQVGIPNIATCIFVYYNRDLFRQAGLAAPPRTYDELVSHASALTRAGQTWGYTMPTSTRDQAFFFGFQYFHQAGANFLNEAWTANGFNNEGGLQALTFLTDLFLKHKVSPPAGAYNRAGLLDLFRGGKTGMMMEEVSQHGDFKRQGLPFEYGIFLQPPGPVTQTSFGNYGFFMISQASRNKEAAWEWIKYLSSAPVLSQWAEQHGFTMMRGDVELYRDDPIYAMVQREIAPKIQGFQLHPRIREIINGMWSEFEGAFTGQVTPRQALERAAAAVDAIVRRA